MMLTVMSADTEPSEAVIVAVPGVLPAVTRNWLLEFTADKVVKAAPPLGVWERAGWVPRVTGLLEESWGFRETSV
jgi:hypothetical protein